MRSRTRYLLVAVALLGSGLGGSAAVLAEEKSADDAAVFEMREVSSFEKNGVKDEPWQLTVGEFAACSSKPDASVKAYPKLHSKHPLYGTFSIGHDYVTGKAVKYHFVLDESGEPPIEDKKEAEASKADKQAKKSRPPKLSTYDRLYIDLNRDLDLTNDRVIKPVANPPWESLPHWDEISERAAFDYVGVDVDFGPGIGVRSFRLLPWLTASNDDGERRHTMHFVATTARQGRIRMGKHEYAALLAQPHRPNGRFDCPTVALYLKPLNPGGTFDDLSGGMLGTVQPVDGRLYVLSATPLGDKITVRPYRGDFGILKVGPGDRKIKDCVFGGSLASKTMMLRLRSDPTSPIRNQESVTEYRVPVGDYLASYLTITYGRLRVSVSDNYHEDGCPRIYERPRTFFIKVRKDRPFVLDFSNKPEVLFASPTKEFTVKPDGVVAVNAVLVDPVTDTMIRHIYDTSRTKKVTRWKEIAQRGAKDVTYTVDVPLSLDPTVTITNSAGKKVAEGILPFG